MIGLNAIGFAIMFTMKIFNTTPHKSLKNTSAAVPWPIGRTVRELRSRMRLSQERFAALVGVTFPTVNRWENGHARPSPLAFQRLEDLAKSLGDDGVDLLPHFPGEDRL